MIVAVNKLDALNWSESVFEDVKAQLLEFMTGHDVGYKRQAIEFIPVSAFCGINLTKDTRGTDPEELIAWWKDGPTLEDAIDAVQLSDGSDAVVAAESLAAIVSDVWASHRAVVSVKVQSGVLQTDTNVMVLPAKQPARVTELECRGQRTHRCRKGDFIEHVVLDLDPLHIRIGSVLCSTKHVFPVVTEVLAKLIIFDIDSPILPGLQLMCYIHTLAQPAEVLQLVATYNRSTGAREPRAPRILLRGDIALVRLKLPAPVCVDYQRKGAPVQKLSRIILRYRGLTAAAGMILDPAEADR